MEFIFLCSHSISHLFTSLTRSISMWTLEDKLHISMCPCVILYLILLMFFVREILKRWHCYTECSVSTNELIILKITNRNLSCAKRTGNETNLKWYVCAYFLVKAISTLNSVYHSLYFVLLIARESSWRNLAWFSFWPPCHQKQSVGAQGAEDRYVVYSSSCTWSNCMESRFLKPPDNWNQKSFPLLSQTL